jgi:hypothetical protein
VVVVLRGGLKAKGGGNKLEGKKMRGEFRMHSNEIKLLGVG